MSKKVVLIPAAGSGVRFGSGVPKQYTILAGKTVLEHTVDIFLKSEYVDDVVLVVADDDLTVKKLYPEERQPACLHIFHCGGDSRAESVRNGVYQCFIDEIVEPQDWILVHDAARCCLHQDALTRLIQTVETHEVGGILAIPVSDTLKKQTNDGVTTVERSNLWQAQTPQMFRAELLQQALSKENLSEITDEASAIELMGLSPLLVHGDVANLKLTYPQDALLIINLLLINQLAFSLPQCN